MSEKDENKEVKASISWGDKTVFSLNIVPEAFQAAWNLIKSMIKKDN